MYSSSSLSSVSLVGNEEADRRAKVEHLFFDQFVERCYSSFFDQQFLFCLDYASACGNFAT